MTEAEREAEVAALIARAEDPDDEYDGHHGNDDSNDSFEYALVNNPEIAEKIRARILAFEGGF